MVNNDSFKQTASMNTYSCMFFERLIIVSKYVCMYVCMHILQVNIENPG